MKLFVKKIAPVALAMLCLLSMSVTAFATPVEDPEGEENQCCLSFIVTDSTHGIFMDDITITLLGMEKGREYTFAVTNADYLFGFTVGGMVEPDDYNVALNYDSKGSGTYTVQNEDGSAIKTISADGGELALRWVVVYNGEANATEPQESTADDYVADTDNEEANAVWNAFLGAIAPIETDSRYSSILKTTKSTAAFDAKYYEKATGNSADEYLNMTPFEQFLWYATYVDPVNAITAGDYDYNCGSVENWLAHGVSVSYNLLKTFASAEMLEAYEELMVWDYNYFLETGSVYNFLTGKGSNEENPVVDVPDPGDVTTEPVEPEEPVVEPSAPAQPSEPVEPEEEGGIWDDTKDAIKDNMITIAILVILAGALVGIIVYRKKKTIDDE